MYQSLISLDNIRERLLPTNPDSCTNLRDASSCRPSASGRQPFQVVDVLGLKKRGQGLRSWICVDKSGNSQVIEVDKFTMMRRCDLPARDLRLLDPLFVYPSTILGREKAIVVNLEQIRCIITADEVLLLNYPDSCVLQYVVELQRRLKTASEGDDWQSEGTELNSRRGDRNFENMFGNPSPDCIPFEFRVLEVALEAACTFLDSQITEKKRRMESSSFCGDQLGYISIDGALSVSAPVTPVSSPPDFRKLENTLSSARSRPESTRSSETVTDSIQELEMLLEAYFVVIDSTLNKLTSVLKKEYIDDTEDFN